MAIDATTLKLRYPAFKNVDNDVITYWLNDAARIVTVAWGDDQEPAMLALAAHSMALNGVLAASSDTAQLPTGVTRFRSGSVDLSFSDAAAAQAAEGGYQATSYGKEFAIMLRRNTGGPFLTGYVEDRPWLG